MASFIDGDTEIEKIDALASKFDSKFNRGILVDI